MIVLDADRVEEIVDHLSLMNSKLENTVLLLRQLWDQMTAETLLTGDVSAQEASNEINDTANALAERLEGTRSLQSILSMTPEEIRELEKSQIDELQKLEAYMQTVYCGFIEALSDQDGTGQPPVENAVNTSELQQAVFDSVESLEITNIAALSNIAADDSDEVLP